MSIRLRLLALVAAGGFLAVALTIRALADGALEQHSGTALYASMVYAGVFVLRPRTRPVPAGVAATVFCWVVETAQLTGVPAALSAHSLLARLVLGVRFDPLDLCWYPVGVLPLVALHLLLPFAAAVAGNTGHPAERGALTMDDNQFIGLVAQRTGASSEQATAFARATLTTLAERIDGGEARDLADRLPAGLRPYAFGPGETAERFGLDVFVQRVSGRADVDVAAAKDGVTAVFDVLREAVGPAAYAQAVGQLPAEYGEVADQRAPFVERTR
ncbi:DUF2809 domain-containing protein [Micromonospora auratinigra]|uniref:Uncharacterized conserved protein, DUF2267 family n=1 Tax=Micromonospora auratinigra TaxID=261654 RepID=A0A1A8ZAE2_9ACTN|nr:DUF2809 domain-containing protein [Micromonospora auratinigra]SBT40938.1 Uncharacterized conserved protein, DUF2267 family [Micromonospora auratinigra]